MRSQNPCAQLTDVLLPKKEGVAYIDKCNAIFKTPASEQARAPVVPDTCPRTNDVSSTRFFNFCVAVLQRRLRFRMDNI